MSGLDLYFGRYRLLRRLGDGWSTRAYKARWIGIEGFEKEVVVWRLGDEAGPGGASPETMIAEAKQAAFLSHANIAQVLDIGVEEGECFVTTEYVAGASLASLLAQRALPWPVVVHIGIQVAGALDYAHARRDASQRLLGIVHRSVSPHRILLSASGGVKLTGFGTTSPDRRGFTEQESRYRSPEQRHGEPVDGRSDVYSLALAVRESLSSRCPIEIDQALSHALERYPENRATAADLRDALRSVLQARGQWVSPGELARLVGDSGRDGDRPRRQPHNLVSTAAALEDCGAVYTAIDHLEAALDARNLDKLEDVGATLDLYERFGELCLRVHVGDRGAPALIAGLDLADGVGRDDYVARLCVLLAELMAQADRLDESREWRERARQAEAPT